MKVASSKQEGACLFLKDRAEEDKVLESCESFRKYAIEHEPTWSEFFKTLQYNYKVSGIILITGVVTTTGWGIAVFAGNTSEQIINFSAPVGAFASTGAGISFQNIQHPQMTVREGPSMPPRRLGSQPHLVKSPDGSIPRDQTIFLRYVKIKYRVFGLFRNIVAAGARSDDEPRDSPGPELEPSEEPVRNFVSYTIPGLKNNAQGYDPLDEILDYILEVSGLVERVYRS